MNTQNQIYVTFTDPAVANTAMLGFINKCYPGNRIPVVPGSDETGPFLSMGNTLTTRVEHDNNYSMLSCSYSTSTNTLIGSTVFHSRTTTERNPLFVDAEESGIYTKHATSRLSDELLRVASDVVMADGERSLRMAYLGRCLRLLQTPWMAVQVAMYAEDRISLRVGMMDYIGQETLAAISHVLNAEHTQQDFDITYVF